VKKNPELIDRYIAATNGYGNIKDVIVWMYKTCLKIIYSTFFVK
jgi:hypothetical protein